uniref:Uncharacterized protein n=1 Tax=Acrobeloides nanus TaxID=290746 RepID=A0A914E117_9BILA
MTAFYTNNWSWKCTKLCACNDKGKCYQPYGTIGFHVVPYCEGTKCAMYLATFNEGTILSVMLNDSFAIANQSGQIVDNNGQILQAPNPFMTLVGPKSGYPVISSIGCDGCAEITSLHCPISTVEHDFLVNTFEMSLSESDGELSKNFTNATSVNECSANFSDPQHIDKALEMNCAGQLINEKNEIIDSKNPETSRIGQKSGYPVITSIGCNGCKGLKKQQCLISTYQNLKIATGLEKVDVNYMNDIRLKLLIAAVIDTISTIFATN